MCRFDEDKSWVFTIAELSSTDEANALNGLRDTTILLKMPDALESCSRSTNRKKIVVFEVTKFGVMAVRH